MAISTSSPTAGSSPSSSRRGRFRDGVGVTGQASGDPIDSEYALTAALDGDFLYVALGRVEDIGVGRSGSTLVTTISGSMSSGSVRGEVIRGEVRLTGRGLGRGLGRGGGAGSGSAPASGPLSSPSPSLPSPSSVVPSVAPFFALPLVLRFLVPAVEKSTLIESVRNIENIYFYLSSSWCPTASHTLVEAPRSWKLVRSQVWLELVLDPCELC
jgi:hypothetical protein